MQQPDLLDQAFDPEHFRRLGHQLIDRFADYLTQARSGEGMRVLDYLQPEAAEARYQRPPEDPTELFEKVLADSIHIHHPGYMGHQVIPPAPLAALAGLMSDLLNNGMGVYEMGQAANGIEREVVRRVSEVLGMGPEAGGFLTSGGTLANLTALLTARSVMAEEEVWREGYSRPLALLVSEQAHYCVDRAVRILGWGEKGIVKVPVDPQNRLCTELLPEYLERTEAEGRKVIAVVGSACSTATGSFDDLQAIADFCAEKQLWFHVDGAHGAAVAFSKKYRSLVRGIGRADSVAMDFHKMLLTPALTTALLYRKDRHSFATFQQQAAYLWSRQEEPEWYNPAKRTFECTKLMMALKVYTLWQAYGPALFEQYVDRVIDRTHAFAGLLRERPLFELAQDPQCNILCFRLQPGGLPEETCNQLNVALRKKLLEDGSFYVVQTQLGATIWLRCTFTNPFTDGERFSALLDRLETLAAATVQKRSDV